MTQSNAAAISNITIIPQCSDNLNEAIEALHSSQITGDYRYPALALAGPLMSEVGKVFDQNFILVYLVTSYKKRQSFNAYLAKMFCDPANPQPIIDPSAVRHKLMHSSSKELLMEAYGSIPDGLIRALSLLGLEGQQPQVYLKMHEQMSKSATLRKAYSHASKIKASTVTTIAALPAPLQSYDLASQCRDPKDVKNLLFVVNTLARGDNQKYIELCEMVVNAAKKGHSISAVLKREYELTPFPESFFPDSEFCKHIANAFELKKTALQFKSCLKQFVPEAIRGEYVYFRWYENQRPFAVVSLRKDHPYGWRVEEIRGRDNLFLDDKDELPIIQYFETHGVPNMNSMEALNRELGMLNRGSRRNPVDDINQVIDGLLDDDPV